MHRLLIQDDILFRRWCRALELTALPSEHDERDDDDDDDVTALFHTRYRLIQPIYAMSVCWLGDPARYWQLKVDPVESAYGRYLSLNYVSWLDVIRGVVEWR